MLNHRRQAAGAGEPAIGAIDGALANGVREGAQRIAYGDDFVPSTQAVRVAEGKDAGDIEPGGQIQKTQDPLNLVDLIGRFMFNAKEEPQQ